MTARGGIAAVAISAALAAVPAAAAVLRSGEHGTFTRLAFEAPGPVTAAVAVADGVVTVAFTGDVPPIELDAAFSRIGRSRIGAVGWDADGATLRVDLSCDCRVSVFQTPDGHVAVDVVAPGAPLPVPGGVTAAVPPAPPPDPAAFGMPKPPSPPMPDRAVRFAALPGGPVLVPPASVAAPRTADPKPAQASEPVVPDAPDAPDAPDNADTPDSAVAAVPLILEPISLPLAERFSRALREDAVGPRPVARLPEAPQSPTAKPGGAQIATRDGRAAPLRPRGAAADGLLECTETEVLADILAADPSEARAALPDRLLSFAGGGGTSARALRDGYLAANLGAEARALSDDVGLDEVWPRLLAAALDRPRAPVSVPDEAWRCGAAGQLVALALAEPPDVLTGVDREAIARLAGSLPMERRQVLFPPAIASAEGAGADDLAARLRSLLTSPPAPDALAAAAARAETMARRLDAGATGPDLAEDALALLPTMPEGAARDDLVSSAAAAVAIDGDLSALAGAMLEANGPQRRAVIDDVVRLWGAAPAERRAVLSAALLRWRADAAPAAARRLAAAAAGQGLQSVALRWGAAPAASGPAILPDRTDLSDGEAAWLSRDLSGAAQGEGPRARLAAALLSPDAQDDVPLFARARARLEASRERRGMIAAVLDGAPGGTTDP